MKQYLQRMRCSSSLFSIAIFYTILFTLLGPRQTFGIRWLALSKLSSVATVDQPPSKMCDSMKGSLIKKQITFCKRNPMFMDSVQRGAAQAIDECQFQFRSRRWNCSTLVQDKIDSDYQQLRAQLGDYGRGSSSTGMEGDRRYSHMLPPSKMSGTGMSGRQTFSGDQLQSLSNLPYQSSQQQHRSLLDGTNPNRMQVSPSSSSSNMMGFGSMSSGQQFLNDEPQRSGRDNSRNRRPSSYRSNTQSNSQKQVQQPQYSRRSNAYDSRSSNSFQSQQGRYNSNYGNVRNNRGINSNGGQYNKNVRRGRRLSRKARHGQNGTSKQSNDEVTNDTSMITDKLAYDEKDNGDVLKNNAVPLPNVGSSILQSVATGVVGSTDGIQAQPSPWLPRQQSSISQGNSTAPAGGSLLAGIPLSELKKEETMNWSDDGHENRSKNKRQRKNNRENRKKRKGGRGSRKDFGRQVYGKDDRQLNSRKSKRGNNKKKSNKADWAQALGSYPVVSSGTREMAFVHAISSAGVAHALTRACSSGELENCGCDRSLRGMSPEGFQWSGCSDNVDFGITFSRTFVDARDRRKSRKRPKKAQPLMNLHNNEAGRKLLERNMKVECKCHGVSGSCELKTCWRSVAPFRMIGQILKDKFDSAHEVHQKKKRGRRMLLPRFERFKPHTDTDLVYLKSSPDYCEFDVKRGSLGTHGRECDHRSPGIDGCELMCCNRGYTTRKEKRVERCKCKFHWCCFVECEECVREVEVSVCN